MHAVGSGHEAALKAFQRIVKPATMRFAPDVILVRAAYPLDMRESNPLKDNTDLHAMSVMCDIPTRD